MPSSLFLLEHGISLKKKHNNTLIVYGCVISESNNLVLNFSFLFFSFLRREHFPVLVRKWVTTWLLLLLRLQEPAMLSFKRNNKRAFFANLIPLLILNGFPITVSALNLKTTLITTTNTKCHFPKQICKITDTLRRRVGTTARQQL